MNFSSIISLIIGLFKKPSVPALPAPTQASAPIQYTPVPLNPNAWLPLVMALTQFAERCYLKAYPDPASPLAVILQQRGLWYKTLAGEAIPPDLMHLSGAPWTAGWGSTGKDITEQTILTQEQADTRLQARLVENGHYVDSYVKTAITSFEKAALVDFIYNIGIGNFQTSTMLKLLNADKIALSSLEFMKWDLSAGKVNAGVINRRKAETELFTTGVWTKW